MRSNEYWKQIKNQLGLQHLNHYVRDGKDIQKCGQNFQTVYTSALQTHL